MRPDHAQQSYASRQLALLLPTVQLAIAAEYMCHTEPQARTWPCLIVQELMCSSF